VRGQRVGSTVAAVFGLVYVLVNTSALPTGWMFLLRVLAGCAAVAVLVAVLRSGTGPADGDEAPRRVFGRGYWWVVIGEVAAIFVGVRLLDGPLDRPEAGVAWVSVVVGVHFHALAVVFGEPFFHRLGALITACGAVGLVLAFSDAGELPVDLVAGVVPGAVLLGFGWWGAHRTPEASSRAGS
jgi:hypothetical protein